MQCSLHSRLSEERKPASTALVDPFVFMNTCMYGTGSVRLNVDESDKVYTVGLYIYFLRLKTHLYVHIFSIF